jgi:small-conductance mechanosensitive channel
MKSSPIYSPFTALALKTVGLVMILSSLLNIIILPIPYNPGQRAWWLGLSTQVVDQGIYPMIGIAFLLAGYWVSSSDGALPTQRKSSGQDLRFWAFLLSSLLGLIFLLLVPVHFTNIVTQSNQELEQIKQQATQTQTQLQDETQRVNALIGDPKQLGELDKVIESGKLQGPQLAQAQALREQLNKFKQDPKALNQQVEAKKAEIQTKKQQAEDLTKTNALKSGIRTGLISLMLALGYIAIGWTGLRGLLSSP